MVLVEVGLHLGLLVEVAVGIDTKEVGSEWINCNSSDYGGCSFARGHGEYWLGALFRNLKPITNKEKS